MGQTSASAVTLCQVQHNLQLRSTINDYNIQGGFRVSHEKETALACEHAV